MSTSPLDPTRGRRPPAGFTLMEVLAAVFLTTIVITAAVSFYINLSSSATRATETMRRTLHASAMLDRLSRDLESASLVSKKEEVDPLAHPWYFVADSRNAFSGSDRVKFLSRSQKPRASSFHGSDLAQIVYFTEPQEDETLTLYRWVAFGLPTKYPIDFPDAQDERSLVLADGLERFSMRFLSQDGEWAEEWDSTQLVRSGQLPIAVELSVEFRSASESTEDAAPDEEPEVFVRDVVLASRSLDLQALIEEKAAAMAELAQAALGSGSAPGDSDAGDAGIPAVSCLDLCLSQQPESFCRQLLAVAEDSPQAAAFRAQYNCQ